MKIDKKSGQIRFLVIGLVFSVLLSGCKQDTENSSIPEYHDKFVTASIVDNYSLVSLDGSPTHRIDLTPNVKLSEQYNFQINEVRSLSSDLDCEIVSRDTTSFTVRSDRPNACDYQYTIALKSNVDDVTLVGDTLGYTRVLTSVEPEELELIPFGIVAFQGMETEVNLQRELVSVGESHNLNDYVLDGDIVVTPSDSASLVEVDTVNNVIRYTPDVSFEGNEKVSYKLRNPYTDEVLAGHFIATVATESKSGVSFTSELISLEDTAKINEQIEVPINEYVDSAYDYQLIYVSSFGASVKVKNDEFDNKAFIFEASAIGTYFVNLVVTDHHGGYDVALLKINVMDPDGQGPWTNLKLGLDEFSAPLTVTDATAHNVHYTSSTFDDGVGLWVSSYVLKDGEQYCNSIGSLPDADKLQELVAEVSPTIQGWPSKLAYWAMDTGTPKVINIENGNLSTPSANEPYYVTCQIFGSFSINTTLSSVDHIVADGVDTAVVVAEVGFGGKPVEGAPVTITVSGDAQLMDKSLTTDANGRVRFEVTNTTAEKVVAIVEYEGVVASIVISYVGDVTTSEILQRTTVSGEPLAGTNQVTSTLEDYYNNPIKDAKVDFQVLDRTDVIVSKLSNVTDGDGEIKADVNYIGPTDSPDDVTAKIGSIFTRPDGTEISAQSYVTFTGLIEAYFQNKTYTITSGNSSVNALYRKGTVDERVTPDSCQVLQQWTSTPEPSACYSISASVREGGCRAYTACPRYYTGGKVAAYIDGRLLDTYRVTFNNPR